jgi:hypothetical protein
VDIKRRSHHILRKPLSVSLRSRLPALIPIWLCHIAPQANAIRVAKILTGEIEEDTGDSGKDKAAQALGQKGGAARRDKLSLERRAEIARKAAAKRWAPN